MKNFLETDFDAINDSTFIIDVDGTLVADCDDNIGADMLGKLKTIASRKKIFLCSNGSPEKAKRFATLAGIRFMSGLKPFFANTGEIQDLSDVVVVGDKFLTDGLFAGRLGAKFLKVSRIKSQNDSLVANFSYFLDDVASVIFQYIKLIRPWQWIKNLLIFAPLFFAGRIFIPHDFFKVFLTFLAFSVAASFVYVINDIFDKDDDAVHLRKKSRPIASGAITIFKAYFFTLALGVLDVILLYVVPSIIPVVISYVVLNFIYSKWLKHIAVVDVICVSVFYIMRVVAGGVTTDIQLSSWIILCVFFVALFVIVGKRRAEYENGTSRRVLSQYSVEALNFMLSGSVALAIISYSIYTILAHSYQYLVYSTLFVTLALFRVMNRIYTHPEQAEAPESLIFRDLWVFVAFVFWLANIFIVFYV